MGGTGYNGNRTAVGKPNRSVPKTGVCVERMEEKMCEGTKYNLGRYQIQKKTENIRTLGIFRLKIFMKKTFYLMLYFSKVFKNRIKI